MTSEGLGLSREDVETLARAEESLWRAKTRYDRDLMDRTFAPDFFEFGRSGRAYGREEMLFDHDPKATIDAVLPLQEFEARAIAPNVALVTYVSEVAYGGQVERGRRSSLWTLGPQGWELRFHQGTPI